MTQAKSSKPISQKDIDENRVVAAIGYLGILCLVPLLMKKNSPYAQHHGKQGFVLLIAWIALWIGNVVPILGTILWVIGTVVFIMLMLLGLINALNGEVWEMPFLGKYAKDIKL